MSVSVGGEGILNPAAAGAAGAGAPLEQRATKWRSGRWRWVWTAAALAILGVFALVLVAFGMEWLRPPASDETDVALFMTTPAPTTVTSTTLSLDVQTETAQKPTDMASATTPPHSITPATQILDADRPCARSVPGSGVCHADTGGGWPGVWIGARTRRGRVVGNGRQPAQSSGRLLPLRWTISISRLPEHGAFQPGTCAAWSDDPRRDSRNS